jgi:hypothetical protein
VLALIEPAEFAQTRTKLPYWSITLLTISAASGRGVESGTGVVMHAFVSHHAHFWVLS